MSRSTLSITAYLLAMFVSGIVVGAFGYRLVTASPVGAGVIQPRRQSAEEFRRNYVEEMQRRLHLDATQTGKLQSILDDTRDRYRAFRTNHKAELDGIHDAQVSRIHAILNDQQNAEYDRIRAEREKRRSERAVN